MKQNYLQQNQSSLKYIGFAVLLFFIFALGWNVGVQYAKKGLYESKVQIVEANNNHEIVDMQLYWDAWNIVSGKYVDPHILDTQTMVYGAIRGMVAAIGDPYTAFMTPKENKEFQNSLEGTLEGIGAELTLRNSLLTIVSPIKNSPAKKAGIQPEDIIYKVDGELTSEMTLEQAVMKIRGAKGTPVTLTLLRKGHQEPFDVIIIRDTINIESVEWRIEDNIAIVELNQFGDNTQIEFSKAINEILTKGSEGMILDLRYNGGGYLNGAVDIASEFIEKGVVVTIKKRNPEDEEDIYVNGKARVSIMPLVVLINKGSASASEIVAGAIQDHQRGYIIGENSFGKGTVQEVVSLIGGSSLRVTIAKWFTPNGNNITETGIIPDMIVERTIEDFEANEDPQMEAAVEYLQNIEY